MSFSRLHSRTFCAALKKVFPCTAVNGSLIEKGESKRQPVRRHLIPARSLRPRGAEHLPLGRKAFHIPRHVPFRAARAFIFCLTVRIAFPYVTGKAAAFPVAKHVDLQSKDFIFLPGCHRYWCSEDHVSSEVSNEHKKCPELLLGRLSPPLELYSSTCLAMAKVRIISKKNKYFRENLPYLD